MEFANISGGSLYLQCVHASVPSLGVFRVGHSDVSSGQCSGLRRAMRSGALAWRSCDGEPDIPGSPAWPSGSPGRGKGRSSSRAPSPDGSASAAAAARNVAELTRARPVAVKAKAAAVKADAPTGADILADGESPASLDAIVRHNRAKRMGVS